MTSRAGIYHENTTHDTGNQEIRLYQWNDDFRTYLKSLKL